MLTAAGRFIKSRCRKFLPDGSGCGGENFRQARKVLLDAGDIVLRPMLKEHHKKKRASRQKDQANEEGEEGGNHGLGGIPSQVLRIFKLRVKIPAMDEVVEIFSRSSGPGGQHVNKVSTAVTLQHPATGLSVTVSDSRSQARNRAIARERLAEKILDAKRRKTLAAAADAARERRRKARRSRGNKARLVEAKRRRGETKKMRGKIRSPG